MKGKKRFFVAASLLIALVLVAGCSSTKGTTDIKEGVIDVPQKFEPVTLRVFNAAGTTQATFNSGIKAMVEAKYPHITLELVMNAKGTTMAELIAANAIPDVVYGKVKAKDGLVIDLEPLMKKYKFDPNSIKPRLWQYYEGSTGTKQKIIIPMTAAQHVLHVNKDLFDRFGVPYPKDGMTWDQTYELAKRVARTDNGIKYLGFNFSYDLNLGGAAQRTLEYFDAKGAVVFNSDPWKNYFANFTRFFEIPGNDLVPNELGSGALFYKTQRVAMHASQSLLGNLRDQVTEGNNFNWDFVSFPVFPDAPTIGSGPNTNGWAITVASKHPDDAFLAIQEILSVENQLKRARGATNTVLANDEPMRKVFGTELTDLAGKNVKALMYLDYSPGRSPNDYNDLASGIPAKYFAKIVYEKMDINTALRMAEDEITKNVEAAKKAGN